MSNRAFESGARSGASSREPVYEPWTLLPVAVAVVLSALAFVSPNFYDTYMSPETGVVETVQFALLVLTAWLAARLLTRRAVAKAHWFRVWSLLLLVGAIYVGGEEASWGQHYLGWSTPDTWQAVNDQNETNLHNTSSWLDQKPRAILEVAVLFGALLLPLARRTRLYPRNPKIAYLVPTARCVPAAAMVLAARIDDWVADYFTSQPVAFYRPAEVEELFIYTVLVIYSMDLLRRVKHRAPRHDRAVAGNADPRAGT